MTALDDIIELVEARAEQVIDRLDAIGLRGTSGPDGAPSVSYAPTPTPMWDDGWWTGAIRKPAFPQRSGGPISPWSTVVHTTDMVPEDFAALVHAWTDKPGDGACAHFLIGRTEQDGVVQFVPVTNNGNHAGGPGHGVYDTAVRKGIHPNLVAVGIEVHCAGGLREVNSAWRFVEGGACHGAAIPDADVIPDPIRAGRGWHRVTDYQYAQIAVLLADLELVLAPLPVGASTRSLGEVVPTWGAPRTARVVGHVSLDPTNRSDPWPPTCNRLFRG